MQSCCIWRNDFWDLVYGKQNSSYAVSVDYAVLFYIELYFTGWNGII